MKPTQTTNQDIRRRPNGSIDFDFYRTRAAALRGQAMRDAFTLRAVGTVILTMTGVLAVVFLFGATPTRVPVGDATVLQTNAMQVE